SQTAINSMVDHALDETQIISVGGCGARKVTRLLYKRFLCSQVLSELFAKPLPDVHGVELVVPKRVGGDGFASGGHLCYDLIDARAFRNENVYAIVLVHDALETDDFSLKVEFHLWHINSVHVLTRLR